MKSRLIETERLSLRPLTSKDMDHLHQIFIDPGVRKYLWDDEAVSKETTKEIVEKSVTMFEEDGKGLWAVSLLESDEPIGFCGFWFFHEPPQLEILYGIAPLHWGHGLATEAAKAMMRYGFERLGFERVIASTDAPNTASVRVMERLGMTFQKRELTNGLDTIYYMMSREDFAKRV
jgi:ribosomal-protein-alanine N-acetyltransferase